MLVALSGFDLTGGANLSIGTYVTSVSAEGFDWHFSESDVTDNASDADTTKKLAQMTVTKQFEALKGLTSPLALSDPNKLESFQRRRAASQPAYFQVVAQVILPLRNGTTSMPLLSLCSISAMA